MGEFEVESLSISDEGFYFALKEPRWDDGSVLILKALGLLEGWAQGRTPQVQVKVRGLARLKDPACDNPSRVTDLLRQEKGFLLVGNCEKSEAISQLWFLPDEGAPQMLYSLKGARLEGLAFDALTGAVYLSSDNGSSEGSDFYKGFISLPMRDSR
jgi:hypothetical protein